MKYIVASSAGCTVGPGQRLRLAAGQIAVRTHALAVIDADKGEVEAHASLFFKSGEVIDLPLKWDGLDSYFRSVLEPEKGEKPTPEKTPTPTGKTASKASKPGKSGAKPDVALKAAEDAVAASKAKLEAAGSDDDKATATAELAAAEAALAKLKG